LQEGGDLVLGDRATMQRRGEKRALRADIDDGFEITDLANPARGIYTT